MAKLKCRNTLQRKKSRLLKRAIPGRENHDPEKRRERPSAIGRQASAGTRISNRRGLDKR